MTTITGKKRKLNQIEVDKNEDVSKAVSKSKKIKAVTKPKEADDAKVNNDQTNGNSNHDDTNNNNNNNTNNTNNNTNSDGDDAAAAAWSKLEVSAPTRKAIDELQFERMTEIQYKAIPPILAGNDLAGAAKTGSGKTLAFIIPAVELLVKHEWKPDMGLGVLVVAPTRELAIQIQGVAQKIIKHHPSLSVGLVIGGGVKGNEANLLKTGCSLLVATPGRLLDHLQVTKFTYSNLKMLIIDEADHILDIGFERQMNSILDALPTERQTLLFSATLNDKMKSLVAKAFRNRPVFVKASGGEGGPTADKLLQMYAVIPQDKKLISLLSWLRQHKTEKILIFFSTKNATHYYESLFTELGIPVWALYGAMAQNQRTKTFFEFVEATSGILLATNVASRGLDFPAVHWIIQFDPPEDPKEYIHRVGRTARAGLKGEAITFLQESELSYLNILRDCNLELKEIKIEIENGEAIQKKVEEVVQGDWHLRNKAAQAFRSFYKGYRQRASTIFNNEGVDSTQSATSFGLTKVPPLYGNFRRGGRGGRGRGGRGRGGGK